jgi:hypothetical protein
VTMLPSDQKHAISGSDLNASTAVWSRSFSSMKIKILQQLEAACETLQRRLNPYQTRAISEIIPTQLFRPVLSPACN